MVVVIDYGMGNVGSIENMLKRIGETVIISSDSNKINEAKGLILPGVGAFDAALNNLEKLNLINAIEKAVKINKIPILGICLGMQLLTEESEEGQKKGLGLIEGKTKRFQPGRDSKIKIPHMGWNEVDVTREDAIFKGWNSFRSYRFYFVHSYYVKCNNKSNVIAQTLHGHKFASAIRKDNVIGVQFHPEKSHKYGLHLLNNFVANIIYKRKSRGK